MTTYAKAGDELRERIVDVMGKYHPELDDAGVKVDCLLAYAATDANGDVTGPAIKVGGYPALACIRRLSLKDRVAGRGDAEMLIDGDEIDTWSEPELDALIDHELCHLELATDKEGNVQHDDAERPKLKMRKHDVQFGWFDVVAKRHGAASPEVRQAREMLDGYERKQLYFGWWDEEGEASEAA